MYRTFPLVVLLSLSFLLVMSCRKRSISYDESDELVRFNAYRQVNYPSSKQLSAYAFMEKLKENPAGETLKEGAWLYFDYWALNLDGGYLGSISQSVLGCIISSRLLLIMRLITEK